MREDDAAAWFGAIIIVGALMIVLFAGWLLWW